MVSIFVLTLATVVALLAKAGVAQLPSYVGLFSVDHINLHSNVEVNNVTARSAVAVVEAREFQLGIDAAIYEANQRGGVHGVPVRKVFLEAPDIREVAATTAEWTARATAAMSDANVLGSVGTGFTWAPLAYATAGNLNKPNFGGILAIEQAYMAARSRHQFNVRMSFEADSHMMVKYMTQSRLRCKKTGILFADNIVQIVQLAYQFEAKLRSIGYDIPPPVPINFNDVTGFFDNLTNVLHPYDAERRPQCLVILMDTNGLAATLNLVDQHPYMSVTQYNIITPSVVTSADWRQMTGFNQSWYDRTYAVAHFPSPNDGRYTIARSLRRAVRNYMTANGARPSTWASVQGLTTNSIESWQPSSQAMEGYLNARFFIEAARSASPSNFTSAAIIDAVYNRKLFVLDDFTLGPFSEQCSGDPVLSPFACQCNVGTKRLFMTFVNTTTGQTQTLLDDELQFEVGVAEINVPSSACTSTALTAQVPLEVPLIHNALLFNGIHTELLRISRTMLLRFYRNIYTAQQIGMGRQADVDLILLVVPAGVPVEPTLFSSQIPTFFQIQGYAAVAVNPADFQALKDVRNYTNFAPLRYRFAVKDDPLPPLAQWNPFFVSLFPALADYALTAVSYVQERHATSMGRIRILADTAAEAGVVRRAVHHYQAEPAMEVTLFTTSAEIEQPKASYPGGGVAFDTEVSSLFNGATADDVVIVASQNVPALQAVLTWIAAANPDVLILICSSEFVVYDVMVANRATLSLSPKTFFTSGLPVWAQDNYTYFDPADSYGALIATTVYMASGNMFKSVPTNLDTAYSLFDSKSIGPAFGGVVVGPFSNASCGNTETIDDHPARDCQCTKGITRFYVRPMAPWLAAMTATTTDAMFASASVGPEFTFDMSGCGFDYKPLEVPPPDTTLRDIIIIAAAGLVFILLLLFIAIKLANHGKRDNSCAPKDSNKPFAMVFTDIQSSTTLWARAPQHMAPAVDAHHEIIRGIIADFRGYEVKTIGDSFMVAFERAEDAVRFAMELQSRFFDQDWGTHVFDETYRELIADAELKRLAEVEDQKASGGPTMAIAQASPLTKITSPLLNDDDDAAFEAIPYDDSVWRGIRVRVGVHYGMGDIKLDPVSQGYDYYGTVVNTAARVEGVAHGGQICVTEAVMDALTDNGTKPPSVPMHSFDFGPQPLRGLDEPIGLTQVLPERFSARTYPPLRLDVENEVEESEPDSMDEDGDDTRSNISHMTGGSRRSSFGATADDLINHVVKRVRMNERIEAAQRIGYAKVMLDALLSTSTPKWRETAVATLADKWRVADLRKEPGMGRFRRRLSADEVNIVLLAYRVSTAAETRRSIEDDHSLKVSGGFGRATTPRAVTPRITPRALAAVQEQPAQQQTTNGAPPEDAPVLQVSSVTSTPSLPPGKLSDSAHDEDAPDPNAPPGSD